MDNVQQNQIVQNKKPSSALDKNINQPKHEKQIVRVKSGVDIPFLVIVIVLLCLGAVMIYSASYAYAEKYSHDIKAYIEPHLMYAAIGLAAMYLVSHIDYMTLKRFAYVIFIGVLLLMILTAIPGIGKVHHGARRWFEIGPISFQPSELMKLAIILAFAKYYVENPAKNKKFVPGILIPGIVIAMIAVIMLFQSHMSGLIILAAVAVIMMFLGGCNALWLGAGGLAGGVAVYFIFVTGYRSDRIAAWLDPWKFAKDEGWQTIQSLYSISQGGIFGTGIGESLQKNLYLPEPQNDFIFAIWCEELGFVGAVLVIILFGLLVWRGIKIALSSPNKYASYVVLGIVLKVALQALLNMAVVTNTIPNTGISLPFFSYGGTSLLFLMIEMGIVLSVSRYSYLEKG